MKNSSIVMLEERWELSGCLKKWGARENKRSTKEFLSKVNAGKYVIYLGHTDH
jgi:hypothetical protein